MGCGGSKGKTKGPGPRTKSSMGRNPSVYRNRTGFTINKNLINKLTASEKQEFMMVPDANEFFAREELPKDKYIDLLKAVKANKSKEYLPLLQNYKISTMDTVTGLTDTVELGNQKEVKGEDLNPLHWAVFENHIEAVKAIVNNQIFNILIAGKVPSNTGLANESEVSIQDVENNSPDIGEHKNSFKRKTTKTPALITFSERHFNSIPRSLILFWTIDRQNLEMFEYLWNLPGINWGLKNLKFQLTMVCIKEDPKFIGAFLLSPTFSRIVNSLTFDEAMDYLEAFVIKNDRIPDETKDDLFDKKELLVYDFMGELTSLGNVTNQSQNNVSQYKSTIREECQRILDQLEEKDIQRIKSSQTAMKKIAELRKTVQNIDDSEFQNEIIDLLDEIEGPQDRSDEGSEDGSEDQSGDGSGNDSEDDSENESSN